MCYYDGGRHSKGSRVRSSSTFPTSPMLTDFENSCNLKNYKILEWKTEVILFLMLFGLLVTF